MKILTLGNGFVANHLPYERINERLTLSRALTRAMLEDHKPDVLINCIGKTGRPNVDWCESNKSETFLANTMLPSLLADECEKLNIHLIHIGSGCVYFGQSPNNHYVQNDGSPMPDPIPYGQAGLWAQSYSIKMPTKQIDDGWKEDDFANPQSYYSKTKYACDLTIGPLSNVTILRIRMPVSSKNDPRNFINKIRGYKKVIDIPNSMTMMDDLVRCVEWVAQNVKTGIYHVANPQPITAAQVMREFQKYQPEHQFDVISEAELDTMVVAKRSNCILSIDKLTKEGFMMTPSNQALEECMKEYIRNI